VPKMRDLLHSRPRIDEEEMALAQSRTAQRLADLFGQNDAAPAEAPFDSDASPNELEELQGAEPGVMPSSPLAGLGPWPGGPRPPIVVEGEDLVGVETESDHVELVGVMARSGDLVGGDGWELPLVDATQLTLEARPRTTTTAGGAASSGPSQPVSSDDRPGRSRATRPPATRSTATRPPATRSRATRTTGTKARSAPAPAAVCPYCALLLQPPPASSRRCTRCRKRIVMKRIEGRAVYLTEAAVLVFDAERRRVATAQRLGRERERWLRLAAAAGAPAQRLARLAAAPASEETVGAARTLFMSTVDRAFRAAKLARDWEAASRIRREQAMALYRIAGSPLPPPADVVNVFREGVAAELRGVAEISREAELVSASCCDICLADDRRIFRITSELRLPRLPHEGCPRGLCRCGWDLAARDRTTMRRYLRRRPRVESRAAPNEPAPPA
jgi:hypothetical protein